MGNDVLVLQQLHAAQAGLITELQTQLTTRVEVELDQQCARAMGEAARSHLPVLGGEFMDEGSRITFNGYAGAPEGITGSMAFFLNGRPFDDVVYPLRDEGLSKRFAGIAGMGLCVRASITHDLDTIRNERFWRFDGSPSGHYIAANWRQATHCMNPAHERFAFPPLPNIERVVGEASVARFAIGGATIFRNADALLAEFGKDWSDFGDILDWGCGAGRLTRYLISDTPCRVTGADIDPDNIAWCQGAYAGADFVQVPLRPPTVFADCAFDLVFGISVVTHLQEEDQWLWLAELQRITKPGAFVLLSVRGPTYFAYSGFPPAIYRRLQVRGYIDLDRDSALDDVMEDKDYYRAAVHSREYILRRWSAYFEVLAIVDAVAGMQDFVVLRRR